MIEMRMLGYRSGPPGDPELGDVYRDLLTGQSFFYFSGWFPVFSNDPRFESHYMIPEKP